MSGTWRKVSGMDSNLEGLNTSMRHNRASDHGLMRRASDMDSYCPYCDTACFVDRVLPDGRRVRMHTCYFGMDADLAEFGQNYLTATNPYLRRTA
jgi:hypothetical protein